MARAPRGRKGSDRGRKGRGRGCDVGSEEGDGFVITATAFLLTYQSFVPEETFKALTVFDDVCEWSICHERGSHDHTHVFVVLKKPPNRMPLDRFMIGALPNCSPSSARGKSFRRSWDRAHFYVICEYKTTHVWSGGNYQPMRDYAVDTIWVTTLWKQNKLTEVVECCARYRCLTPTLESVVTRTEIKNREVKRRIALHERSERLRCDMKDFRFVVEVEYWKLQYETVRPRYQFLWLSGPSGMGKTMYAQTLGTCTFLHSAGVNWNSYDPVNHDLILFDDVYDMEDYINKHKPIFQASRSTTVNTSRTNCFAQLVDTAGKKIVICSNEMPTQRWVLANCIHYQCLDPMWVDTHAIEDA